MDSEDKRLLEASASGQTDRVLQLIEEHGQQLHKYKDQDGKTPLHLAATNGHSDTVSALIMNGADISAQDLTGHTALQRSAAEGHVEVAKQLISRGCPMDHQDDVHGNTALHEASWRGFSRTVEALCKNKSNYYLRNRGGFSPLHLCCQNGHNESCRVLLRAGCKPNIKNNYGDTPLHTAARYGHAGVARILLSAASNPNLQNKNGDSPLHIAAAMGRRKLVKILLESPLLEAELTNQQNETALNIAERKNHQEIATMIRHPPPVIKNNPDNNENETKAEINVTIDSEESKHFIKKCLDQKKCKKIKKSLKNNYPPGQEPKWSPYGCHYYPDMTDFPEPQMDTLPNEPLKAGEQYFLDLAGNIKKGPSGHGSTCYCAPFIHRFEQKMDKNKKDLVKHLEQTHGKLAGRINHLERKTRDQISSMSNNFKENLAQERVECHDRMDRRAIRDRIALDRSQAVKHSLLRQDLSHWLDSRIKNLEQTADNNQNEQVALLRTLLRGSKRRKRALRSELTSGALRRALSEDEEDEDTECAQSALGNNFETNTEYNFVVHNTEELQERLRGLRVSDHPSAPTGAPEKADVPINELAKPEVRVRRNSAGDETMVFCDFGDFNTQELISSDLDGHASNTFRPLPPQSPPVLYQNMVFNAGIHLPPQLPPKLVPPPYRPPPTSQYFSAGPRPFEEGHTLLMGGAMSSSDGGSHDSHNDSGYCIRGSGGPSPSLSGSQGRPDSRGPPALIEVHEPPSHTNQVPLLKASLGPVLSNGNSVAPRIRQLQMQLGQATSTNGHQPNLSPKCAPRGSLV